MKYQIFVLFFFFFFSFLENKKKKNINPLSAKLAKRVVKVYKNGSHAKLACNIKSCFLKKNIEKYRPVVC